MKYLVEHVPIGKRVVPETERVKTLKELEEARIEVLKVIETFPVQRVNVKRSHYMER